MKRIIFYCLIAGLAFACGEDEKTSTESNNKKDNTSEEQDSLHGHQHASGHHKIERSFTPMKGDIDPPYKSIDGLPITATISEIAENAPYIILCHQAGSSRGEYKDLSDWLNTLGFNTLAIDQRSGKEMNGIVNRTAERAKEQELPTDYLDAEQDIRASIAHIADLHLLMDRSKPIYLMGSSYSASLVIKIAADTSFDYHKQIAGVMSFSPGEYFSDYSLSKDLPGVNCPIFITCSKDEVKETSRLADLAKEELTTFYAPQETSRHGASAMWESTEGYSGTREALSNFLNSLLSTGTH